MAAVSPSSSGAPGGTLFLDEIHVEIWCPTATLRYSELKGEIQTSKQPTVADYIVRRLASEWITDCFGVAGDFAFRLNDAVARSEAIRWIGCSNELGAGVSRHP